MNRSTSDDTHRGSVTLIPCEFCHEQQPQQSFRRHEVIKFDVFSNQNCVENV